MSRRSSEEMRLTLETIGITGIRCTGVKRSRGVQAKESVQRESGRKLPHCPYSLYFREGVFSETGLPALAVPGNSGALGMNIEPGLLRAPALV